MDNTGFKDLRTYRTLLSHRPRPNKCPPQKGLIAQTSWLVDQLTQRGLQSRALNQNYTFYSSI
jgi:hypothetical protein